MERNSVVITGIGVVSPLGSGSVATWDSLVAGASGLKRQSQWTVDGTVVERDLLVGKCCELGFFEAFPTMKAPFPLRFSQMAIMGCGLALDDAELRTKPEELTTKPAESRTKPVDSADIGLIINSDLGANAAAESYAFKLYTKGAQFVSPFEFTKSVSNCVVGDVARQFNITGASSFIIGENSLSYGLDLVQQGKCKVAICGGVDEVRDRMVLNYARHGFLYDGGEQRGKTVLGEGSCFLVLEEREHAIARGVRIYAELVAEYSSADLLSNELIFDRDWRELSRNLRELLETENLPVDAIDFVVGDSCLPAQIRSYDLPGIAHAFPDVNLKYANFKTKTGEMFSASGLFAIGCGAMSVFNNKLGKTGIVSSFALGGNITSVILKSFS
jgi:3-oxoacyl-[acyl-carrier-protein] synthase II